MTSREQFENQVAKKYGFSSAHLERYASGEYRVPYVAALYFSWQASRAVAIEDCATECERTMMFPNGKQESFAHHGVEAAAAAIRQMKG